MRVTPDRLDGLRIVFPQSHEQRLFPEAPDVVTAVFFNSAQDAEILTSPVENSGSGPPDRLDPVVVTK